MTVSRAEFVRKLGELLNMAKPNLVSCELKQGKDISDEWETFVPEDEYVVVTCENGCTYKICVEANSLCGIANDVFSKMLYR